MQSHTTGIVPKQPLHLNLREHHRKGGGMTTLDKGPVCFLADGIMKHDIDAALMNSQEYRYMKLLQDHICLQD